MLKFSITERVLFFLPIFLLPSSLAYHLILPSSYVQGILVDYLIPTIYLTDIFIIILFVLWFYGLLNKKLNIKNNNDNLKSLILNHKSSFINHPPATLCQSALLRKALLAGEAWRAGKSLFLVFGLLFLVLNIWVSKNPLAAAYKWLKLAEMGWLGWYIHRNIQSLAKHDKVVQLHNFVKVISLSILWQSILAFAQWFKQGNIFPYWLMGESQFSIGTPAVKTISWFGQLKVVPMGTFPHPNVLAAFLCLSMLLLWDIGTVPSRRRTLRLITFILGTMSLFFTFSLPAWSVFLVGISIIIRQKIKLSRINQLMVFGLVLVALSWGLVTFGDPASWLRRKELINIAFKMWQSSPVVGVGLNNFTVRMPEFGEIIANIRFLQPVHNIFLLIFAETGIIGFGLFFYLLFSLSKTLKLSNSKTLIVCSFLFLSLFDHYFLTTQQGLLMAVVLICLIGTTNSQLSNAIKSSKHK